MTVVLAHDQIDWLRLRHARDGIPASFTIRAALNQYRARLDAGTPTPPPDSPDPAR
jgi:hypothetical protein